MLIGKGSYGEITAGNNNTVIKKFNMRYIYYRELFYLSLFKGCPNICQIVDYDHLEKRIMMTRYSYDLLILCEMLPKKVRIELANTIIEQVLIGLQQLHNKGIIHGDLVISNVFCNYEDNILKCYLGDFSLSCIHNFNRKDINFCHPPETIKTTKFDIWSLGVLICNFLSCDYICPVYEQKYSFLYPFYYNNEYFEETTMKYIEKFLKFSEKERLGFKIVDKTLYDLRIFREKMNQMSIDNNVVDILINHFAYYDGVDQLYKNSLIDKLNSINMMIIIKSLNKNIPLCSVSVPDSDFDYINCEDIKVIDSYVYGII